VPDGRAPAYGWLPTILELHPESPNIGLAGVARLLARAKRDGVLTNDEIDSLASVVNNSLVGASKLLHFVAPEHFAIRDSRIYAFVFERKPSHHSIRQVERYRDYLDILTEIRGDPRFPEFHRSVDDKVGYRVSALRGVAAPPTRRAGKGRPSPASERDRQQRHP
jgi:hypothetical protein